MKNTIPEIQGELGQFEGDYIKQPPLDKPTEIGVSHTLRGVRVTYYIKIIYK